MFCRRVGCQGQSFTFPFGVGEVVQTYTRLFVFVDVRTVECGHRGREIL